MIVRIVYSFAAGIYWQDLAAFLVYNIFYVSMRKIKMTNNTSIFLVFIVMVTATAALGTGSDLIKVREGGNRDTGVTRRMKGGKGGCAMTGRTPYRRVERRIL